MQIDHSKNIIRVDEVSFSYTSKEDVLADITFSVHPGDYLGIVGPNGGGKTTLLKIMLGLLKPTKGTVRLFGEDIEKFSDWQRIGYVPQKATAFDPNFPATVEDVVMMGTYGRLGLFRYPGAGEQKRLNEVLVQVEMDRFRGERIGNLSGGQQQRVFIARALAGNPDIIFLDEPTVGVDAKARNQFYALLQRLNKELGLTLVLVSHELDVISREVTEVLCVNTKLVCYSTPEELGREGTLEKLYGEEFRYIPHMHGSKS